MILSIRHKGLKLLYERGDSSKIRPDLVRKIENILTRLDAAKEIRDMNAPGLSLHLLKGGLRGYWAVTVKANWRIIFKYQEGDVLDIDLLDYH